MAGLLPAVDKTDRDHCSAHVCELYQYVTLELWIHM